MRPRAGYPLVRIRALTKSYARERSAGGLRRTVALNAVSLDIHRGEIAALCGSAGSGKTTLLQCVGGLRKPDYGRIEIEGEFPTRPASSGIAYVPASPCWYPFLTVRDVLEIRAMRCVISSGAAHAVRRTLRLLDLMAASGCRVSLLERDMINRLAMAEALLGEPKVIMVDTSSSECGKSFPRESIAAIEDAAANGSGILLALRNADSVSTSVSAIHFLEGGRLRQNSLCVAEQTH